GAGWEGGRWPVLGPRLGAIRSVAKASRGAGPPAAAMEGRDYATLGPYDACGFSALNGALCAGQERGWRINRLDLRNSGETSVDHSRVVGYGAWAICAAEPVST